MVKVNFFWTYALKKSFLIILSWKSAKAKKCIDIFDFFSILPLNTKR